VLLLIVFISYANHDIPMGQIIYIFCTCTCTNLRATVLSHEYYDATLLLANDSRRIIDYWIQVGFKQPRGTISQLNLQPEDSVNNAGSRTASKFTGIA